MKENLKTKYHCEITKDTFQNIFLPEVLQIIIEANIGQDALKFQVWHDHYHFDNNSFDSANKYCDELRLAVLTSIKTADFPCAWKSFGKLTHTVQDLYAHSNYVNLWLKSHPDSTADMIDPASTIILESHDLISGKLYYPLEVLSFVKILEPVILPFLPKDSHAWMNLDDPSRLNFDFAKTAASRRTLLEYQFIAEKISTEEKVKFSGN